MTKDFTNRVDRAVQSVRALGSQSPRVGLVLGSGLANVARGLDGTEISFSQIEGFPIPTVEGHRGIMVLTDDQVVMVGRFHYYEGHDIDSLVLPVFVLYRLGVRTLIVTNASGGVNPDYLPGDLVLIRDHINLLGINPLRGPNNPAFGPRFPDMTAAYTPRLRELARSASKAVRAEGVYAAMAGPSYETPAEIRMLRAMGADMVGMSTVPEVIAASYLGMEVLGISCITNLAAGLGKGPLSHEEVVETGKRAEESLSQLVREVVRSLVE